MTVPRILHRIVLPPLRPAGRVETYWSGFKSHNPGWEFRTWSDSSPSLWPVTGHLFRDCNSPAQIADIMRLEILWREGGVYVDVDCESVRPLAPLLEAPTGFFIGTEDGEWITNSVIGAHAGHPATGAYLDAITAGFDRRLPPNISTGPHLATRVLKDRADVTVHPPVVFYPEPGSASNQSWRTRTRAADFASDGAYVVHRWAQSWDSDHAWIHTQPLAKRPRIYLTRARKRLRVRTRLRSVRTGLRVRSDADQDRGQPRQ